MYKKIIIIILGIGVVVAASVWAFRATPKIIDEGSTWMPIEGPEIPAESPTENNADFGRVVTLNLKDRAAFPDGLFVYLYEINDSRCKPNVQCIWAGEIAGTFMLAGGTTKGAPEVRLGTARNKSTTANGYTFSLQSATETSMTITVVKN